MPDIHEQYCSAANLFICKKSGKIATITYCEKTEKEVASNYCAELTGSVIATLVICALSQLVPQSNNHTYEIHCDNMGAVSHGNGIYQPLP